LLRRIDAADPGLNPAHQVPVEVDE